MQYKILCITLCGILLAIAACAPLSSSTPTPNLPPPTATILPPTDTPPAPTATSLPPTPAPTAIPPEVITEIDTMLRKMADEGDLNASVLIGQKGKVLLSEGYGFADKTQKIPNTPATRFRLASITKQFTAMSILMLQAQGKLNVKDPICNYISDCPSQWKEITIHHLLTHTSGIPEVTELSSYERTQATPSTPEQTIARFKNLALNFQPGEKWKYSNSGYIVLGYIIEQVSGQTYEEFLQQAVFTPLNLRDTGYEHNADGLAVGYNYKFSTSPADYIDMSIPFAAGALYSTVEDLYTWENALTTEQLIPMAYLDEMFTPHMLIPNAEGRAYGYGWVIGSELGRPSVRHSGLIDGFAAIVTRYIDDQIVIIVLSNQGDLKVDLINNKIAKKLFGLP